MVMVAVGLLAVMVNAAPDGKGTNVFGHVRVKDGLGINFGGVTRTNWPAAGIGSNEFEEALATKLDITNGVAVNLVATGTFTRAMSGAQTITVDGADIAVTENFVPVQSDSGEKTASIANGTLAGQMLIIMGVSDTDYVTLTNNAGYVDLIEAVDFSFREDNTMQLIWNGTKWVELHRGAK